MTARVLSVWAGGIIVVRLPLSLLEQPMAEQPKYAERYCAYVDILGFSELVGELRTVPSRFETIRTVLTKIRHPYNENIVGFGDTDLRAQSISDAVAISTLPTPQGLSVLCASLRV